MMVLKRRWGAVLPVFFVLVLSAVGQSGRGAVNIKDRVLDILFRSDGITSQFLSKMTLRYGDSDSQLVVLTYPVYPVRAGGHAEVMSYAVTGMGNDTLSQFISRMVAQKPDVTDREIAARLKVDVKRLPIRYEVLRRSLDDLEAIQISPVLAGGVSVDEYSEYEFWYSTGQETVHYTIVSPFGDAAQDALGRWMIKFRRDLPHLLKEGAPN